jgi:hypothetical protein
MTATQATCLVKYLHVFLRLSYFTRSFLSAARCNNGRLHAVVDAVKREGKITLKYKAVDDRQLVGS